MLVKIGGYNIFGIMSRFEISINRDLIMNISTFFIVTEWICFIWAYHFNSLYWRSKYIDSGANLLIRFLFPWRFVQGLVVLQGGYITLNKTIVGIVLFRINVFLCWSLREKNICIHICVCLLCVINYCFCKFKIFLFLFLKFNYI